MRLGVNLGFRPPRPYTLGRVAPGADFSQEIAMERAPKVDDRVILCNGVGDYQHGRFAPLRFDR